MKYGSRVRNSFFVATHWKCWLPVKRLVSAYFLLLFWKKKKSFRRGVPTKRKTWCVKAMWRVCAVNSWTDCLTGFLRESFCQPEFSSWSAVEVFFSLSCLHLASWAPPYPPPPPAAMWPVTLPRLCHDTQTRICCTGFVRNFHSQHCIQSP